MVCGGDVRRAACEINNMVFSAPIEILDDLLRGLKAGREASDRRLPHDTLPIEYPLPREAY